MNKCRYSNQSLAGAAKQYDVMKKEIIVEIEQMEINLLHYNRQFLTTVDICAAFCYIF